MWSTVDTLKLDNVFTKDTHSIQRSDRGGCGQYRDLIGVGVVTDV